MAKSPSISESAALGPNRRDMGVIAAVIRKSERM